MRGSAIEGQVPRNAHDVLFKHMFSRVANAASELRAVLPPKLAKQVRWKSMRLAEASVVSSVLGERHGDLLFESKLKHGSDAYVWLIFEHQSTVDRWLPLRIHNTTAGLLSRYHDDHPKSRWLPAIVSVVLYHGEVPWKEPTSLVELMNLPAKDREAWEPYVPSCRFVLDDLGAQDDEALMGRKLRPYPELGLVLFKHARSKRLLDHAGAARGCNEADVEGDRRAASIGSSAAVRLVY